VRLLSKLNIIPIFVPHLGCPNDCVFCNQKKIAQASTDVDKDFVINRIEEYLSYFKDKSNVEIAFYGGSFTAIDMDVQNSLLEIARSYKTAGKVKSIRLSTRPDCIDENILFNLKDYLVDTIELGVQSMDDKVLDLSKRGHDAASVYKSSELIKNYGFTLGLQQMIGLPGDSKKSCFYTACEFKKIGPKIVRIYPALVIKATQMQKDYEVGKYKPISFEDTIAISKELVKFYELNNIEVIRLGLQPTDNIQLGKDVVAGPFHPSIRQFVDGEIMHDIIFNFLKDRDLRDKDLTIFASNKNISNISGQKSIIKRRLIKELELKDLHLKYKDLDDDTIIIFYENNLEEVNLKKLIKTEIVCD
jgi:histone acetyltransferase (RNA polymerase elongator complex component)